MSSKYSSSRSTGFKFFILLTIALLVTAAVGLYLAFAPKKSVRKPAPRVTATPVAPVKTAPPAAKPVKPAPERPAPEPLSPPVKVTSVPLAAPAISPAPTVAPSVSPAPAATVAVTPDVAPAEDRPTLYGVPYPDSHVSDIAGVVDSSRADSLNDLLADLEARTTAQFVVLTVTSTDGVPISAFARDLFNTWQLGQKDVDNGALLVVAVDDHAYWITVGDGLASVLTKDVIDKTANRDLLPGFRRGDYASGISLAVTSICRTLARHYGVTLPALGATSAPVATPAPVRRVAPSPQPTRMPSAPVTVHRNVSPMPRRQSHFIPAVIPGVFFVFFAVIVIVIIAAVRRVSSAASSYSHSLLSPPQDTPNLWDSRPRDSLLYWLLFNNTGRTDTTSGGHSRFHGNSWNNSSGFGTSSFGSSSGFGSSSSTSGFSSFSGGGGHSSGHGSGGHFGSSSSSHSSSGSHSSHSGFSGGGGHSSGHGSGGSW